MTKWTLRPAKTDQSRHSYSLIRVFAVCMKKHLVLSYPDPAQTDQSLRWAHRSFYWFCRAAAQMNLASAVTCLRLVGLSMALSTPHGFKPHSNTHTRKSKVLLADATWFPLRSLSLLFPYFMFKLRPYSALGKRIRINGRKILLTFSILPKPDNNLDLMPN